MPRPNRNARTRIAATAQGNLWAVARDDKAYVEYTRDGRSVVLEFSSAGALMFACLFRQHGVDGIQTDEEGVTAFLATERKDPDMPVGVYTIKSKTGAEHGITQAAHHAEQDEDGFRTVKAWCGKTVTGLTKWTHLHDTVSCTKCQRSM